MRIGNYLSVVTRREREREIRIEMYLRNATSRDKLCTVADGGEGYNALWSRRFRHPNIHVEIERNKKIKDTLIEIPFRSRGRKKNAFPSFSKWIYFIIYVPEAGMHDEDR
jgi:hypothetical protein